MATIYKGTSLAEGPAVSTWKIGVGGQTKRTFEGKQTDITNKALELQYLGYETEITSGPKWTLVATINVDLATNPGGTEPEPVPQWEIVPHNLDQDILECGRALTAGLPSSVKAQIEAKLKNPQNKSVPYVLPADNAYLSQALRIYALKQMGIDSRRVAAVSLKRTITVSSYYNANWSSIYNLRVWSKSGVVSYYGVPNVLVNLLPNGGYKTENVSVGGQTVTLGFYEGYLEQLPSYQTVGTNRISISQEWIYSKWLVDNNGAPGLYDFS